jgi:hypothetical protein
MYSKTNVTGSTPLHPDHVRGNNGTGAFIVSKEGITQGDPLSMFAYVISILPLICLLKAEFPAVVNNLGKQMMPEQVQNPRLLPQTPGDWPKY